MRHVAATKNSRLSTVRLRSWDVGRPRKNDPNETAPIGFRVTPELRDALDEVVQRVNAERPGRSMSRTELIKLVLYDWLKRGAKPPK